MKFYQRTLSTVICLTLAALFSLGGILDIPLADTNAPNADPSTEYTYPLPSDNDLPSAGAPSSQEISSSEPESSAETVTPENDISSSASSGEASSEASTAPPPASSAPVSSTPLPPPPVSSQPDPEPQPLPEPSPSENGKYVVGYYASWGRSSGLPATSLNALLLTHINYAFADIDAQNRLTMPNPTADKQNFADLRTLKESNPHIKTLISVGGWDYSKNFSSAAATASSRESFANSCVDFILEHGFDGVDLDWEFPSSADKQNFTLLLQAVRSALDAQGAKDGRYYYLTIAWSPSTELLGRLEAGKVASLVDYIFMMGYDIHGPWDKFADFNAQLYPTGENSPHYALSLSEAVQAYRNAGVPAGKIVLGMPFYGYQYTTNGDTSRGYFSSFSSAKSVSFDKLRTSLIGSSVYTQAFHEAARVPYLYNENTFISYDDEASIAEKASFAAANGLAGVGAWELSQDKNSLLLSSAYNALNS